MVRFCPGKEHDERNSRFYPIKIVNYSLNGKLNKDEFVQELTQNLPDPPPYFPSNVKLNQEGYSDLDDILKKSLKK
ncbi:MAG: hypothetical protein CM15mP102_20350 [Flavobacteriales bacterium]|nr:MAG: hypothetical protein CM15mP102_20350 [Flavobacteriales bacterium]